MCERGKWTVPSKNKDAQSYSTKFYCYAFRQFEEIEVVNNNRNIHHGIIQITPQLLPRVQRYYARKVYDLDNSVFIARV